MNVHEQVVEWCKQADELAASGRLWDALERYNDAILADPIDTTALRLKALALQRAGEHAAAATVFDRALLLDPEDPETHYIAAYTRTALGHTQHALTHLQIAASHEPRLRFEMASDAQFRVLWDDEAFAKLTKADGYR
jgi:tetratricopeptide (TPR) repeat protein